MRSPFVNYWYLFSAGTKSDIIFIATFNEQFLGSKGIVNMYFNISFAFQYQFLQHRHPTHRAFSTLRVVMASVHFKKVVINAAVILDTLEVNAGKVGI